MRGAIGQYPANRTTSPAQALYSKAHRRGWEHGWIGNASAGITSLEAFRGSVVAIPEFPAQGGLGPSSLRCRSRMMRYRTFSADRGANSVYGRPQPRVEHRTLSRESDAGFVSVRLRTRAVIGSSDVFAWVRPATNGHGITGAGVRIGLVLSEPGKAIGQATTIGLPPCRRGRGRSSISAVWRSEKQRNT